MRLQQTQVRLDAQKEPLQQLSLLKQSCKSTLESFYVSLGGVILLIKKVKKLFLLHKSMIDRVQKEMGLSTYTVYWIAFGEGAFVMWLILKIVGQI